jgi:hypothetical protein
MGRKSLAQRALEHATKLRDHLLSFTCKLVRLSRDKRITGLASGFIVKRGENWCLLSAGHALKRGKWFLETEVVLPDTHRTVVLPVKDIITWTTTRLLVDSDNAEERKIDFAIGRIDYRSLRTQAQQDPVLAHTTFEFQCYQGPLDSEPILETEPYAFASWSRGLLINGPWVVLERSSAEELGMIFVGLSEDGAYYCFKPCKHKGHKYYKGASGSPITDPEGKIVSMLLAGHKRKNTLYGLPLARLTDLLDTR